MTFNLLYKSDNYPDGFLSPAQVTDYLRCPQCMYLSRVEKIPRPLSVHFAIGDALHRSVQTMRNHQQENVLDVASDTFDQRVAHPLDEDGHPLDEVIEIELGQFESLGKAKDVAIATVKHCLPLLAKLDAERGEIAATEVWLDEFTEYNPFPFAVKGKIDCLYRGWLIEDLKSSGKSPDKARGPDISTGIQLSMYMLCLPKHRGVVDVAVKTKHPDLHTYWLAADSEQRQNVYDLVVDVAERISAGDFPARPSWQCSYVHNFPAFQVAVGGFA